MAVMTDVQRLAVRDTILSAIAREAAYLGLDKPEIRQIVDAADQYISDNAVAMNTAIPAAVRAKASTSTKARIYAAVMLARYTNGV